MTTIFPSSFGLFVSAMVFLTSSPCFGDTNVVPEELPTVNVKILITYHSLTDNTAKMAQGVAEGARSMEEVVVVVKPVSAVTANDLFSSDAIIVGSPVYWSNMAGEVKTFFDNWQFKFGVYPEFKMRDKVGAAFSTGGGRSNGKELTMLTILSAMLGNQMIVVSGGGAFGASATTEGESPGIDAYEYNEAQTLGRRVAEVASLVKGGQLRQTRKTSP
ncbi:MAG: flavodoxin [Nitrospiraceae bacterium]|jgi:NAD(P)H dehydrogenase (quinone)|nr:flavodoxin [Nitrospiraceae bacterium]